MQHYALVTGTSSGLGFELASYLLDEGYTVFGLSRRGTNITHGCFNDIVGDVRSEADVEQAYEIIRQSTEYLDLLVNNAGICEVSPVDEISSREFADHLHTNVLGTFHILKHFKGFIKERVSHVVTISSLAAHNTYPGLGAYASTKSSLESLIDVCRTEWMDYDIRFSTLVPGPIDTGMWDEGPFPVEKGKMLAMDDFMHVFSMIVKSSSHVHFPQIIFANKNTAV